MKIYKGLDTTLSKLGKRVVYKKHRYIMGEGAHPASTVILMTSGMSLNFPETQIFMCRLVKSFKFNLEQLRIN